MPHQCTTCGHVFADGSKEMLSGCPDCGGTKFQFHPDGADIPEEPPGDAEPPERPAEDGVAGTVGNAAATVKSLVGSGGSSGAGDTSPGSTVDEESVAGVAIDEDQPSPAAEPSSEPAPSPTPTSTDPATSTGSTSTAPESSTVETGDETRSSGEDSAQASARSEVVSPDELPETEPSDAPPRTDSATVVEEPDDEDDRPDLSDLREELNDQFESIKVVAPGQYELNLMELYDREEYIIALQEDGKYTIQVPDRWED